MPTRYHRRNLYSIIFLSAAMLLGGFAFGSEQTPSTQALVQVAVVVRDKTGRSINSLRKEDFLLTEGDSAKAISSFSQQEVPISYGLVVDATGSMRGVFTAVVEAANAIVKSGKPTDEGFILRLIDGEARVVIDWTSSQKSLLDELGGFDHAFGRMSIIDSLVLGADHFSSLPTRPVSSLRRTALVVITDGQESGSKHTLHELVNKLKALHLPVLAICLRGKLPGADIFAERFRDKAILFLNSLTKDTGGYVAIPQSGAELQKAATEVLDYDRSQYIIGYVPSSGQSRHSDVHVRLAERFRREGFSVSVRLMTR